jgi:hypothetical protein
MERSPQQACEGGGAVDDISKYVVGCGRPAVVALWIV